MEAGDYFSGSKKVTLGLYAGDIASFFLSVALDASAFYYGIV